MLNNLFGAFTGTGAVFAYAIVLVFAYGLTIWIERSLKFRGWTVDSEALWTAIVSKNWTEANALTKTHPVDIFHAGSDTATKDKGFGSESIFKLSLILKLFFLRKYFFFKLIQFFKPKHLARA